MPAGRPKSISNDRVFDVAKPGKAKPVGTSRPVIVNHDNSITDGSMVTGASTGQPLQAPSVTRKVIRPITITSESSESGPAAPVVPETAVAEPETMAKTTESSIVILNEPKKSSKKAAQDEPVEAVTEPPVANPETAADVEATPEPNTEPVVAEPEPAVADPTTAATDATEPAVAETAPEVDAATAKASNKESKVAEETTVETEVAETPAESTTSEAEPPEATSETDPDTEKTEATEQATDDAQSNDAKPTDTKDEAEPTGSDAAGVDALAEASTKTKEEQKAVEEQAKRDAALQGLIDSKKYFVPLAHDATEKKSHGMAAVLILILLLLVVGAYLAIDAKVIHVSVNLPYHFFKQ